MKTRPVCEVKRWARRCLTLVIVWPMGTAACVAFAQQPASPAFEVASVRLSMPDPKLRQERVTDTRVDLAGVPLWSVLLLAFRVEDYQLFGPTWARDASVDIHATIPNGGTRREVPEMLQRLLVERFGLAIHRERKTLEVHELSVGKDGITMQEVESQNELDSDIPVDPGFTSPAARALANRVVETPDGPVRTVLGDLGRTTITGQSRYQLRLSDRRTQLLNATRMTMAELATVLQRVMGEPVVDRTGLAGLYQFTIELPVDAKIVQILEGRARFPGGPLVELPNVSASRAVEGLGLRLERRRAQIDTVVVDKLERVPTGN